MATPAQVASYRRRPQDRTGPRPAERKATSRLTSLRHCVDNTCDPLTAEYQRRFVLRSLGESHHSATTLRADRQKRRLQQVETDLYNLSTDSPADLLCPDTRLCRSRQEATALAVAQSVYASPTL